MGANYDAAVMSSGYVGLALGATPKAFIIVLLIGAFFIDLANAIA
jgi:ESS family glutamate:Na+ symporter